MLIPVALASDIPAVSIAVPDNVHIVWDGEPPRAETLQNHIQYNTLFSGNQLIGILRVPDFSTTATTIKIGFPDTHRRKIRFT